MGLACRRFLTVLHNSVFWLVNPLASLDNSYIKLSKNCRVCQNKTKSKHFIYKCTCANSNTFYICLPLWHRVMNYQDNSEEKVTLSSVWIMKHDLPRSKNYLMVFPNYRQELCEVLLFIKSVSQTNFLANSLEIYHFFKDVLLS